MAAVAAVFMFRKATLLFPPSVREVWGVPGGVCRGLIGPRRFFYLETSKFRWKKPILQGGFVTLLRWCGLSGKLGIANPFLSVFAHP